LAQDPGPAKPGVPAAGIRPSTEPAAKFPKPEACQNPIGDDCAPEGEISATRMENRFFDPDPQRGVFLLYN